ncbi:aminotransferase class III-fold pyridoxal phosphate-dependent enzyme (plasmid) [Ponticoccus alexandrii]|uniref:Aminotransferase class III-fold pyridoxal phosphate-dependent enzyme n=1 Tax=Ponticoccus alexandrii TaxID=1943633 RepID=A0ABX7FH62_9RHOB|nr:aminotransferase class III-fold pyridoxal phosphate-dependent enzyme [Ponticoccus alexandrii]
MAERPDHGGAGRPATLLLRHYGIAAQIEPLASEEARTDEVQPGFGRTGAHMWGFQRNGIVPDLATLGKPMGNGFPIGAVVGRQEPMERFGQTARYSNTFAGNTVGIAAADAVLTVLQRDDIPGHAARMGARLCDGLRTLAVRHEMLRAVRHAGLFIGVDIGTADTPSRQRRRMALDVVNGMRDEGVLISTTGANEDTLKIRPPLVCQPEHADRFIETLGKVLGRVESER